MSKSFGDMSLVDLIPSSITGDRKIQALADGAGQALTGAYQNIPLTRILSRIDELPEAVVELLGWQFHVDYWDTGLTLEQKRNLVKTSIKVHRIKGTPGAIELLLREGFGLHADVTEWWEFGGAPYYFRVSIECGEFTAEPTEVIAAINAVKNTRSWLDRIEIELTVGAAMHPATGAVGIIESTVDHIQTLLDTAGIDFYRTAGAVGIIENAADHIQTLIDTSRLDVCSAAGGVGTIENAVDHIQTLFDAARIDIYPATGTIGMIEGTVNHLQTLVDAAGLGVYPAAGAVGVVENTAVHVNLIQGTAAGLVQSALGAVGAVEGVASQL